MPARPFINHILANDALTRGLADPEARILVEWLVERTEEVVEETPSEAVAWTLVQQLCRRARSIGRFVDLWTQPRGRGAATQLAAVERFGWPLPSEEIDSCDLLVQILAWESCHDAARSHDAVRAA